MISHKHKFIFVRIPKSASSSIINLVNEFEWTGLGAYKMNGLSDIFDYFNISTPVYFKDERVLSERYLDDVGYKLVIGSACRLKTSKEYERVWDDYFKFAFVRNPWDRMISNWKMLMSNISFVEFVKLYPYRNNLGCIWHTLPMWTHIFDNKGNKLVDFIGKFENLQEDFNTICDKIGIPQKQLPHKNATKHKHYTEYYDEETKEIVAKKYAKDIEYFGYKFGE